MKHPLGVTQSVWETGAKPLQLAIPLKLDRENTKTPQFAAYDGPIGSNAISMRACLDAVHLGLPQKRHRERNKTSQFDIKEATTESRLIDFGA